MRELTLHLLDIAENSISAGAKQVVICVTEDSLDDRMVISVQDDGHGMDAELAARVTDPFVSSRTTRKIGLGIPLLKEAAEASGGGLMIQTQPGAGTRVEVCFQRSHIDRMPLGDLPGTLLTLIVGYPLVNWVLEYQVNNRQFHFDDLEIKRELGDIPLSEPAVLSYLRSSLQEGIADARQDLPEAPANSDKQVSIQELQERIS